MVSAKREKSNNAALNLWSDYLNYKLAVSKNYISILTFVASLLNLLLLFPDLALIESASARISILILRTIFSVLLIVFGLGVKKIHSFQDFAIILSLCEVLAIIIFLFVLTQYNQPNTLIQTLGIMTIIIIAFLLPNRWIYTVFIAVIGAIGFYICVFVLVTPYNSTEFMASIVYTSITILLCALSARNVERHQFKEFLAKAELERISTTDFLTHTYNRYKLEEAAERWMSFCRRQSMPLTLVFIDVDNLKIINDLYGHTVGDSVLYGLAMQIQSHLRSTDILARWGGDEFVILLPNVSSESANILIERMENSIREQLFIEGFRVTCSFGAVEMKNDYDFETLICKADKLMYDNKMHGRSKEQYEMQMP